MTPRRRITLLLFLASSGLVLGAAAALVVLVPSFKQSAKLHWHRWSCPDVPELTSERLVAINGCITYSDPYSPDSLVPGDQPNLRFEFTNSTNYPAINATLPVRGVWPLTIGPVAIARRIGDVSASLVSISAGFMLRSEDSSPDVRIVIRIDHADGTLLEWNEKRLLTNEHHPNEWERFNFEWLLRELAVRPDDVVSIFIRGGNDEGTLIDDMDIVFRSANALKPRPPHA